MPTPTLATVARLAEVSLATASRVLNDDPRVRPDMVERVRAAVASTGYVPNRLARGLARRCTDSVALVLREPAEFGAHDPYLATVVVEVGRALRARGLHLVVLMSDGTAGVCDYVRGHVDGALLVSVHDEDPLPAELAAAGVPVVVGGRLLHPVAGASTVDVDGEGGARSAVEHVVASGRRRVAVVAGPADLASGCDRERGALAGLEAAGLAGDLVDRGDWTPSSGAAAVERLLAREPGLDAVVAASDRMAAGALRALRAAGRRVPDDVAVTGFDDLELARELDPPLTTVHQDVAEQARRMVDALAAALGGERVEDVVLPTRLVVRESA